MDIDVDKFISEIEQRPAIWDIKCKEHSDRVERIKQWEEIVNIFTNPSASNEVKSKRGQVLQKRWKTLRDAFVKERRQLAKNDPTYTNKKQYKYYNQLMFLAPVISYSYSMPMDEDSNTTDTPHEHYITTPELKRTKIIDPLEKTVRELVNVPPYEPKKTVQIDKIEELLNVLKSTVQQKTEDEDPDRQFLLSLVSDFKNVPHRQKPMVKINILKCIMEAQDSMYDSHRDHHQSSGYLQSNQQYIPQPQVESGRPSHQEVRSSTSFILPHEDFDSSSQSVQKSPIIKIEYND